MTRWQKWRTLSRDDRKVLLRAAVMLLDARARVSSTEFRPATSRAAAATSGADAALRLARAQSVARLVGMAAVALPGNFTCLHRSLVTWRLLEREGIPCQIQLGVARAGDGPFEAHAWVECQGVPLNEPSDPVDLYKAFDSPVIPLDPGRAGGNPLAGALSSEGTAPTRNIEPGT
jgi:hypothetical protein